MYNKIPFIFLKFASGYNFCGKGIDKSICFGIINLAVSNKILRNCVKVAQQTLTLFVRVRILLPQPRAPFSEPSFRGVAQLGRALRSGRRGRWFESSHLDHNKKRFA